MTPDLSMTSNKKAMTTRKDLAGKTSEQKNPLIIAIHAKMMTPDLSMTSNKKVMLTRKDLAEKTSEQKNPLIIAIHGKKMTPDQIEMLKLKI